MRISGFTMCRNADKLYYPVVESITSVLPLVDEFVVVLGDCDPDDKTEELIRSIDSSKIKLYRSQWDLEKFPNGMVHAQQTDLAKEYCQGDWLLYLQADEVIHQKDLISIKEACQAELDNEKVQGFVLSYHHFWGDYEHVVDSRGWYQKEIRIIRNLKQIHSWQSAQSFRWINDFDGKSYRQKRNTRRLAVKDLHSVAVYHYGWVRPPAIMTEKMNALDKIHSHNKPRFQDPFDYGDLSRLSLFEGTQPEVMLPRISQHYWKNQLNYESHALKRTHRFKHERWRYKLLDFIGKKMFGGNAIAEFQNFEILK